MGRNINTGQQRSGGNLPQRLVRSDMSSGGEGHLVDAREISRLTGVPLPTIYQACKEGIIPHYRLRKAIRFDPSEVLGAMREMARRAVEEDLRNHLNAEPDLGVLALWGGDQDAN